MSSTCLVLHKWKKKKITHIELILEQDGFELRSTYTWIFFSKYILHGPRLVESTDAEPQMWIADCQVTCRPYRVSAPLTCVVKRVSCVYIYIYTYTYTHTYIHVRVCVLGCICMNELWKVHREPANSVYSRGGKLGLLESGNARTT